MKYRLMILLFYSLSSYGFDKFDAAICDAGVDNPARVLCYRNAGAFSQCQNNDATAELSCYKDKINLAESEKKEVCQTTTQGKCIAVGDAAYIAPNDYSSSTVKLPDKQQSAKEKPAVETDSLPPEIVKLESDMVVINGDCFMMGSGLDTKKIRMGDERQHKICVKDFEIGKYEVTQAQWRAVMGNNPSHFKGDNLPVEQVTYNYVQDFIKKLNTQTGKTYRLPTEAEWEYAARKDTTTAFYTGDCINTKQANYNGTYDYNNCGAKTGTYKQTTVAVGSYPANPWGLYDMAGNVWEWTCSVYDSSYSGSENQCESNNGAGMVHVVRGGSWLGNPIRLRSANRGRFTPSSRDSGLGFRLSRM